MININERLKRLHFRSLHRGCKETDMLLGGFAEHRLGALTPELLDLYEAFLEEPDWDIWHWVTGDTPYDKKYTAIIEYLRQIPA